MHPNDDKAVRANGWSPKEKNANILAQTTLVVWAYFAYLIGGGAPSRYHLAPEILGIATLLLSLSMSRISSIGGDEKKEGPETRLGPL